MKKVKLILKKWQTYTLIGLIAIGAVLGFLNIRPDGLVRSHGFCADLAFAHVQSISQKPRSVLQQSALESTRQYIMQQLDLFGAENFLIEHTPVSFVSIGQIPVNNIYARIPSSSGVYVLLMAHYDSHPLSQSTGVGDNAYAVATLLEIARIFQAKANQNPLINGIKMVFTDAEEVGLHGARRLVDEGDKITGHNPDWALDNVNLVINVEGRGIRGPLFMFETSANNRRIINFFASAGRPFAFSFAADIYRILPMITEMGIILDAGLNGINLSTLDSVEYYHTDYDNLDNACMRTLQNYGNTLVPLMIEFSTNSRYSSLDAFDSAVDSVFFTPLPNVFIRYSAVFSWIFIVMLIVGFLVLFVLLIKKQKANPVKALISLGIWLLFIALCALVGYLTALILASVAGAEFSVGAIMSFVPFDRGALIITSILVCVLAFLAVFFKRKVLKINLEDIKNGGIILNMILLIVSAFLLHGATFLFLWPAALVVLATALKYIKYKNIGKFVHCLMGGLMIVFALPLFITISYSVFVGMTVSVLAIILALSGAAAIVVVPTFCGIVKETNEPNFLKRGKGRGEKKSGEKVENESGEVALAE
ncbi:MAG: M28 family peptidase [Firmicutes bacterium]|nr:M28 family peptidase [Bacillota bacterium]